MKCAACGSKARKLRRALVLGAGGRCKRGRVCQACARLGWLLVFGEDGPALPAAPRRDARPVGVPGEPTARVRPTVEGVRVEAPRYTTGAAYEVGYPDGAQRSEHSASLLPARAGSVRCDQDCARVYFASDFLGSVMVLFQLEVSNA